MSSIKCRRCGLTNWAHEPHCKRCKTPLGAGETAADKPPAGQVPPQRFEAAPPTAAEASPSEYRQPEPSYQHQQQHQQQPQQPGPQAAPPPKNWALPPRQPGPSTGLAVGSMVVGIIAFATTLLLIGILIAPVGLVLGIVALVKIKRYPFEYGGKGFAIAGVIVSALVTLWIPVVAVIAIPNLMAARRSANEGSAIRTMRMLVSAQAEFGEQIEGGRCADLPQLAKLGLVDSELSKGRKSGYMYFVDNFPNGGCEMHAIPISLSYGTRSFYVSTYDGMVRHANRGGKRANVRDEILGEPPPRRIARQED